MRFAVLCHPGVSVSFLGALADLGLAPVCVVTKDPSFGRGPRGVLRRVGERLATRAVGPRFGPNTLRVARQKGWEVVPSQLGNAALAAALTERRLDVLAVFGFRLLPAEVLAVAVEGAVGFHPSRLPAHRGAAPLFWQVRSGETEAGYSILRLDQGMDTGPVLHQGRVPLASDDDAETALSHVCHVGGRAFARLLLARSLGAPWPAALTLGASVPPDPRASQQAITLTEGLPLSEIQRRVRAGRTVGGAPLEVDGRALLAIDCLVGVSPGQLAENERIVWLRCDGGTQVALVCLRASSRHASSTTE